MEAKLEGEARSTQRMNWRPKHIVYVLCIFLVLVISPLDFSVYIASLLEKPVGDKRTWTPPISLSRRVSKGAIDMMIRRSEAFANRARLKAEPVDEVQFTLWSSAQLRDGWGGGALRKFLNVNHECAFVQTCKSVIGDEERTTSASLSKSAASINMISDCRKINSKLSRRFHQDGARFGQSHVLLCGEGGREVVEKELPYYDVSMLMDPSPPLGDAQKNTVLFYNPHVRGGVLFLIKAMLSHRRQDMAVVAWKRDYDVSMFVSNCNGKERNRFLNYLHMANGLRVFSFGKCFQDKGKRATASSFLDKLGGELIGRLSKFEEKRLTQMHFRYAVSMENTIDRPFYVTEKIFDAFRAGSIPIYYGTPEVYLFTPGPKSFIDASDFLHPGDLINYLQYLNSNFSAFQEYFLWDWEEYSQRPWIVSSMVTTTWQCALCLQISTSQ